MSTAAPTDRLSDEELHTVRPWWRDVGACSTKAYQTIATLALCRDVSLDATVDALQRASRLAQSEFWNYNPERPN